MTPTATCGPIRPQKGYMYDLMDRLTQVTSSAAAGEAPAALARCTYDERGFIVSETATESLAGYAYDDMDAAIAYRIVEIVCTCTYDDAGKLLSCTETEDNYSTYVYTYEYDMTDNCTAIIKRGIFSHP